MTLIKSISGIRGTIGGFPGEGLSPVDIVKFTSAYAHFIRQQNDKDRIKIVIGRDARISGEMVGKLVAGTLMGMGADVVDLELSTTPTVEVAVTATRAQGGIIITASHNPVQWNALKLLNERGEFISDGDGKKILAIAGNQDFRFSEVDCLGTCTIDGSFIDKHIQMILDLDLVDTRAIEKAGFKIAVDAVNSTGGIAIPRLLNALGVNEVIELYCEPNGKFPHNPEPLPENLKDLSAAVAGHNCDAGFSSDPDVDRLAIVQEDGHMFGEEYTLVAVADYVLQHQKGNTVSNLSSTRSLREVTHKAGAEYHAAAVGEVNVVEMMKKTNAVIGGEGNGGVIYPASHYGRDALVGIALFLSYMATSGKKCSQIRALYPRYHISKNKIRLTPEIDVDRLLRQMQEKYKDHPHLTIDGLKIEFGKEWVHLRKSNTEHIIRVYAEGETEESANILANRIMVEIRELI